jgi:sugar lactone lactonase YvrE
VLTYGDEIRSIAAAADGVIYFIGRSVQGDGILRYAAGSITPVSAGGVNTAVGGKEESEKIENPEHLVCGADGSVYFTQRYISLVRVVVNGAVRTLAGGGKNWDTNIAAGTDPRSIGLEVSGIAVEASGDLLIADRHRGVLLRLKKEGGLVLVGRPKFLGNIAVDTEGMLVTTPNARPEWEDGALGGSRLYKVSAGGISSLFAGNGGFKYAGDGGDARLASLNHPGAIAIAPDRSVYIADQGNGAIRRIAADGRIATFATAAREYPVANPEMPGAPFFSSHATPDLTRTCGLAADAAGNVYLASVDKIEMSEDQLVVRKIARTGVSSIIGLIKKNYRGCSFALRSQEVLFASPYLNRIYRATAGHLVPAIGNGHEGFAGDGGAADEASLAGPTAVAVDNAGNVYIADARNQRIRRVGPSGIIETIAGNGEAAEGGDGMPAKQASVWGAVALAVNPGREVYVVDGTGMIRKIDAQGIISTIFRADVPTSQVTPIESLPHFVGLAMEPTGNLLVLDAGRDIVYRLILNPTAESPQRVTPTRTTVRSTARTPAPTKK